MNGYYSEARAVDKYEKGVEIGMGTGHWGATVNVLPTATAFRSHQFGAISLTQTSILPTRQVHLTVRTQPLTLFIRHLTAQVRLFTTITQTTGQMFVAMLTQTAAKSLTASGTTQLL